MTYKNSNRIVTLIIISILLISCSKHQKVPLPSDWVGGCNNSNDKLYLQLPKGNRNGYNISASASLLNDIYSKGINHINTSYTEPSLVKMREGQLSFSCKNDCEQAPFKKNGYSRYLLVYDEAANSIVGNESTGNRKCGKIHFRQINDEFAPWLKNSRFNKSSCLEAGDRLQQWSKVDKNPKLEQLINYFMSSGFSDEFGKSYAELSRNEREELYIRIDRSCPNNSIFRSNAFEAALLRENEKNNSRQYLIAEYKKMVQEQHLALQKKNSIDTLLSRIAKDKKEHDPTNTRILEQRGLKYNGIKRAHNFLFKDGNTSYYSFGVSPGKEISSIYLIAVHDINEDTNILNLESEVIELLKTDRSQSFTSNNDSFINTYRPKLFESTILDNTFKKTVFPLLKIIFDDQVEYWGNTYISIDHYIKGRKLPGNKDEITTFSGPGLLLTTSFSSSSDDSMSKRPRSSYARKIWTAKREEARKIWDWKTYTYSMRSFTIGSTYEEKVASYKKQLLKKEKRIKSGKAKSELALKNRLISAIKRQTDKRTNALNNGFVYKNSYKLKKGFLLGVFDGSHVPTNEYFLKFATSYTKLCRKDLQMDTKKIKLSKFVDVRKKSKTWYGTTLDKGSAYTYNAKFGDVDIDVLFIKTFEDIWPRFLARKTVNGGKEFYVELVENNNTASPYLPCTSKTMKQMVENIHRLVNGKKSLQLEGIGLGNTRSESDIVDKALITKILTEGYKKNQ